jgi:hypothetical protein
MDHFGTMCHGDFLRAVGTTVDGDDNLNLTWKRLGSGLDRLQAPGKPLFFVAGWDQDRKPHLRLSLPLAT